MHTTVWKQKIQLLESLTKETELLSENSFGFYFTSDQAFSKLYLKPLNEAFAAEAYEYSEGRLINFERELIEEDDQEYALDVMQLFNGSRCLDLNQNVWISNQIQHSIVLLKEEYAHNQCSYIVLKTILKVLMLQLIRFQKTHYAPQELDQKRIYEFLKLMETHYLQETESIYYATKMGISEKRLNQILKEKLQRTAKQIIQQRQITEAKRLLIRSEVTIQEIGFQLEFNSLSSFSRFFKNQVGESPSTYKELHS